MIIDAPKELTEAVIGAAIEVHRCLGPGLLESVYLLALSMELHGRGISHTRQVPVECIYKSKPVGTGFRADLVVENRLVVELKAVDTLHPVHHMQILTYMKLLRMRRGLLINFHEPTLVDGVKRTVRGKKAA